MRKVLVLMIAFLSLWGSQAFATTLMPGLEIMPFAGYRWGGSMTSITGVSHFDVQDTYSWGVTLDKPMNPATALEIYYSHFEGIASATIIAPVTNEPKNVSGLLKRDDIHLNGVWYAYRPNSATKPYFTGGLGTSISSGQNLETVWRFSWNLGLGIRHDMSDRVAIRLEGRWLPVWVTTGASMYCDPWYCYSVGTGESFDQFAATAGLSLKLGGGH
jgi:opacity protein-like surface antigen